MTIITKPITAERKDEKAYMDDFEGPAQNIAVTIGNSESPSLVTSNLAGNPDPGADSDCEESVSYTTGSRKAGRYKFLIVLVISIFLMSSCVYFLKSFMFHLQMSQFRRGFCRLPYPSSSEDALITGQFGHPQSPILRQELVGDTLVSELKETISEKLVRSKQGTIGMEYEMDLELETFEMTTMPEISHGKYLHDFRVNKTLILDRDNDRCFVMELNRAEISPPKSLMEIIEKMKNGAFELDLDEIRHDTRVLLPAIQKLDQKEYGYYIANSCVDKPIYRLIEIESRIVKRSTEEANKYQFMEFGGHAMIKYNIINLDELE